jgi:hypothetical protein
MNELVVKEKTELRVKDSEEQEIKVMIYNFVPQLYPLCGQTPNEKDIDLFAQQLPVLLKSRYRTLTLDEVRKALLNGTIGDYGDYYGLNITSFVKFLNAYSASDEHKKAMAARHQPPPLPELPPRQGMTETELKDYAKDMFSEFKRCGKVRDSGSIVYNYLDSQGLIPFTVEEKKTMYAQAEKELERDVKRNAFDEVQAGVLLDKISDIGVKSRAKRIALNRFFEQLVEKGDEL